MTRSPPGRPKANTPPWGGGAAGVSGAVKRIGVFGGSFDPVHNAHLALACIALDTLALDELRWVPAGSAWQKERQLTSSRHRVAMLELAIAGEPRFVIERSEVDRSGPSYTIDTVRQLQLVEPEAHWFLIVGQDQFANLPTWRSWRELLAIVNLAVAARPGAAQPTDARLQTHACQVLPLPQMPITATDIRDHVSHGESIADLVPAAVAGYIERNALYRAEPRS